MADLNAFSQRLAALLEGAGIAEYAFEVKESEKRELNTEHTDFVLYRTVFDKRISLDVFLDGRKGSASGNDLTDEGLEKVISAARASAEAAEADDANGIAERQAPESLVYGSPEPDMERFFDRVREALSEAGRRFPRVRMMQVIASHDREHALYRNTCGTVFETLEGLYSVMLEYAGNDGERTAGIAYSEVVTADLDVPILSRGSILRQLKDAGDSLDTVSVGGKFRGTVILTPEALGMFTYMLAENMLAGPVIMNGTSLWLDCIGKQVADRRVTLSLAAEDSRLAVRSCRTGDGYRAENVTLIDRGVLKSHILDLFAARKTGRPVTRCGSCFVMENGDTPLCDMIRSVDRGLIVGGFSGGEPGPNGEFSGVAKNSFYIENGQIRGAVMETMISGTLTDVFSKVRGVSAESVSDGTSSFPYLMCEGITVSGN